MIKHTERNIWALNAVFNEYCVCHLLYTSKFSIRCVVSKKWHGPAEICRVVKHHTFECVSNLCLKLAS
jgi:hypothetical protein